jgi:hypothetical protein
MLMHFIDMTLTTTGGHDDIALGINVDGALLAINGGSF